MAFSIKAQRFVAWTTVHLATSRHLARFLSNRNEEDEDLSDQFGARLDFGRRQRRGPIRRLRLPVLARLFPQISCSSFRSSTRSVTKRSFVFWRHLGGIHDDDLHLVRDNDLHFFDGCYCCLPFWSTSPGTSRRRRRRRRRCHRSVSNSRVHHHLHPLRYIYNMFYYYVVICSGTLSC